MQTQLNFATSCKLNIFLCGENCIEHFSRNDQTVCAENYNKIMFESKEKITYQAHLEVLSLEMVFEESRGFSPLLKYMRVTCKKRVRIHCVTCSCEAV